ncbi:helix-turn-helix domain-containing protein [Coraliomargarita akajimensis]|uniref:Transcriptional regulator, AraC family n=1 Tax=Coraliomargarita akajimensis (strain DSM 45221 / IAM 15411 / JCM 23193 / KCTC 12865 / 04OKA010-24) TaxID=583355 RepID=D5EMH7_CORAD|nr:AraC family transcriptional regulator [Coraliomargarita akajimensis]ADE53383.1 transcriptional regulator, AraC family [Coraliomargarita akajimensis DSM 45221]
MKMTLEKVSPDMQASFRCLEWDAKDFDSPHHFHPEIEITEILASKGERLVGDRFDSYQPGDLAMLGSNLPHRYKNWKSNRSHSRVIQFLPDAFGPGFFDLPEFRKVKQLFQDASRGLSFSAETRAAASSIIASIFKLPPGPQRLIQLIELLDLLSQDKEREALASHDFMAPEKAEQSERLQRILNYIDTHWQDKISLDEVSKVACLHPQSLSRYFRQHLRKTFQEYLIELRLSRAARELLETKRTIADIAYDCGFNNLANFNRSFLAHYSITPRDYRKK